MAQARGVHPLSELPTDFHRLNQTCVHECMNTCMRIAQSHMPAMLAGMKLVAHTPLGLEM
jgi:hypothetical protein